MTSRFADFDIRSHCSHVWCSIACEPTSSHRSRERRLCHWHGTRFNAELTGAGRSASSNLCSAATRDGPTSTRSCCTISSCTWTSRRTRARGTASPNSLPHAGAVDPYASYCANSSLGISVPVIPATHACVGMPMYAHMAPQGAQALSHRRACVR